MNRDANQLGLGLGELTMGDEGRVEHDAYFTNPKLALALTRWLDEEVVGERFAPYDSPQDILDPSCGSGNWLRAAEQVWPKSYLQGVDIVDHCGKPERTFFHQADFLKWEPTRHYCLALGNPPYSDAWDHVQAARRCVHTEGLVAFLLRADFLGTKERAKAYLGGSRPVHVCYVSPRPSFGGGSDQYEYALIVWPSWDIVAHSTTVDWLIWK